METRNSIYGGQAFNEEVEIPLWSGKLRGELRIPEKAGGVVVFSHGSGSSRHSPRNRFVAQYLRNNDLGTLLIDLLSEEEDSVFQNRFDINLLTERLSEVIEWLRNQSHAGGLNIGIFGASTGAASALRVAAKLPGVIDAVVSRGGRPDLALEVLPKIQVPVLLIVGGLDQAVIQMNREAFSAMTSHQKQLQIIPGASHLFEEPGKLEEVARMAADWFRQYLI